jgi:hypothetical protein
MYNTFLKGNKIINFVSIALIMMLSGCAQVGQEINKTDISTNISGLVLDESKKPVLVYMRPGAPTLVDYTTFIIDPILVDYSDPNINDISSEDMVKMQQYFHHVMSKELVDSGYQVVTRSAPNTLRVTFKISDLKAPTAASNVSMLLVPGLSISVGEVTIEAVFREALSNQVNAVVMDSSRGSYMFNGNPLTTTSDIETAFDNWAVGFTKAVNEAHGK